MVPQNLNPRFQKGDCDVYVIFVFIERKKNSLHFFFFLKMLTFFNLDIYHLK